MSGIPSHLGRRVSLDEEFKDCGGHKVGDVTFFLCILSISVVTVEFEGGQR